LSDLGFAAHLEKSVFIPQQIAIFLGFLVNSLSMKITLSNEKVVKITSFISELHASKAPLQSHHHKGNWLYYI
jgi:hypothetical protein